MFRFLFRFAGLMLIALSFLFVVYDGTKSIADQTIYISRVGEELAAACGLRHQPLTKLRQCVRNQCEIY